MPRWTRFARLGWGPPGPNPTTPIHIRFLNEIIDVFPDATFVHCHRDTARIYPSLGRLSATLRSKFTELTPPTGAIIRDYDGTWERALEFRLNGDVHFSHESGKGLSVTPEEAEALVARYIAAYNGRAYDALAGLFADDAVLEDPVGSQKQQGRKAIRAFYESFDDNGAVLELAGAVRATESEIAFPFLVHMGGKGNGPVIEVIDTFLVDAIGLIREMRAFWGPANIRQAALPSAD